MAGKVKINNRERSTKPARSSDTGVQPGPAGG